MKIKIIRSTVCGGKPVFEGDIVDASDRDAQLLIGLKKALAYTPPVKNPEVKKPAKRKAAK